MNRAERRSPLPSTGRQRALAQRRRTILFVSLGIFAVLVIAALVYGNQVSKTASDAPISAKLAVGDKAPHFVVSTTGGAFDLAQAGGKPTLLEVFATWCPHCQRETAVLNSVFAKYGSRANVVAVSGSPYDITSSGNETQADVIAFAQKFGVKYPIAFDPDLSVAKAYLQGGFPTVVLISNAGVVQAIRDGEIPQAMIDKALDTSLAGGKPDPKMGA